METILIKLIAESFLLCQISLLGPAVALLCTRFLVED